WEESPPSRELFARSACTNPTRVFAGCNGKSLTFCAAPDRQARQHATLSRRRETDLAQGKRRQPFSPQSAGLPPREAVRVGPQFPSRSTRPGRPRNSAVDLARRGRGGSVSSSE